MKLKHWQGYGSVDARLIKKTDREVTIEVTGAHEYGLVRDDLYDAKKWLLDRFCKDAKEAKYYNLDMFVYEESWKKAIYTFHPRMGMTWKEVAAL